jgi:YYY domain-containing protein
MTSIFSFLLWYITITLLGWITFPIAYRFLPALADRGYTLARVLGLLLWGFFFWLLASIGVLQNDVGGVTLALLLLVGVSLWAGSRDRFQEVWTWVKDHKKLILISEILFLACFILWAFVRSANPEISATEKPMELAFINAILRSPAFPPNDPWLSGYSISYYYFGYVIVTLLIRITGVDSGIAFNLAIALWFALTALGAYGLIFNLLKTWQKDGDPKINLYGLPVLGPIFILIVSNLEGILDFFHSWGLFWTRGADGTLTSSFWQWLNIGELTTAPTSFAFMPTRPGGVLWWRASRVVQDFTFSGSTNEIIDEFPFFSFLLGDLHPHVLSMPFVLLSITLALNLFKGGGGKPFDLLGFRIPLSKLSFGLAAVILGGLAFMNTWDFPFYLILFCGAYVLAQYFREGWNRRRITEFISLAIALGITSVLIYLPFYLGFQSQAGGFLPSLIFFTRGTYFWVMFAPLLIPIFAFLVYLWQGKRNKKILKNAVYFTLTFLTGLFALSILYSLAITLLPSLGNLFINNQGAEAGQLGQLVMAALVERIKSPATWLTLGGILTLILALVYRKTKTEQRSEIQEGIPAEMENDPGRRHGFLLLIILLGVLLTLFPEYFYLLDQFGWRINTIFKFYFEAWILWGLGAAYGTAVLLSTLKGKWKWIFRTGLVLVLVVSFAYPVFGLWDKTNGFNPSTGFTLDGNAFYTLYHPDEMAGIRWLQTADLGVVAEAIGGDYSDYTRVSTRSGMPTVLGWIGHESQWRGGATEMGTRSSDIQTLYETTDWTTALTIIQEYNIKYIYIGSLERNSYKLNEVKFNLALTMVFQQGNVTIYQVPDPYLTGANQN